ncbi:hypothetical protein BFW38_05685 [Terasakiispira papahanaumokuakeensis]|uniref:HEAT repeat domain-containing protein n=1 Tax=Terasakiispira papahanaumokuakeensis TaxID=197479 RepID=A0A1E2V802_9GAMM|nr:hypothetical protein [Terasakiispira papahanaumokuakeensis]ODC03111.1 hypothetical protein BFW38_05685 [Terasakiispira papahanaumokuakeensis]
MLSPHSEEYKALYTDEFGDVVGLDEVQLLDPPLEERVPLLSKILNSSDHYLSYQATLILTAWGKDIGLENLEKIVNNEEVSNSDFSPNRITNEDNVYDELSYAVHLYGLSGGDRSNMLRIFKKILSIYPKYFFESKLKHSLLKNQFIELIPSVENAIKETLLNKKYYQASQLLPVLTKLDSEKGWQTVQKFIALPKSTPDSAANIAEALKYCTNHEVLTVLQQYALSKNPGVAEEARNSLEYISNQ